jgi:hypothetical protein
MRTAAQFGTPPFITDIISEPIGPNLHGAQIAPKAPVAARPGAAATFANSVFKTFGPLSPSRKPAPRPEIISRF